MSKLKLADDLQLPIDACTQTFAWIGRKGSGKTYGAGKLVEALLDTEIQVVIVDTVGNWYGLRIAADGKHKGFDIPVFGGLRQDLPLLATAGDVVADVVMDSQRSVILDVSQFNFSERKRFAADFGTRLWQRKKGEAEPSPLHLVIEECQLIVPQFVQKDDTRMVHVYEEIIRLGRNYGIGVSMLTQRPQSVNKEVLTQAECIMAFQINGVPERKALKEWLTYEGGDVNLVNELPGLSIGTCYLWSPQWLRTFKKVTIGKKMTLDASATPKAGQKLIRRMPTPLDVTEIEARMLSTIEKAKAEDPKALRRKIAELQRALQQAHNVATPKTDVQLKEVPVLKDGQLKRIEAINMKARSHIDGLAQIVNDLKSSLSTVVTQLHLVAIAPSTVQPRQHVSRRITTFDVPKFPSVRKHTHEAQTPVNRDPDASLGRAERAILTAIAQTEPKACSRIEASILSGYSIKSSSFSNALSALRSAGLISGQSDVLHTTIEGRAVLGPFDAPPSGPALLGWWEQRLGRCERVILDALCRADLPMTKEQLADDSGYSITSSSFSNALSKLRSLALIDGRGELRACPMFFER